MDCVVFGVSTDYVYDVLDSLDRLGWSVAAYVCNIEGGDVPPGISPVVSPDEIVPQWLSLPVVFPPITPAFRKKMRSEAQALGFSNFANLIDPTAIVSPRARFGEGIMVNAGSIIASNVILGDFTVLNRGTSIGHHSVLEEYVTFGPSAVSCGSVHVGKGTFVGAGAVILPEVKIGEGVLVGAGAVVTKDVPDRCQIVGNPGRINKTDIAGYNRSLVGAGA